MEGSDAATSPGVDLADEAGTHGSVEVADANSEKILSERRGLLPVCMYAMLKTTPVGALVDDLPHNSSDFGHGKGYFCLRCKMKELERTYSMAHSEKQRVDGFVFVLRGWEPKTENLSLLTLMGEVLNHVQTWCVEKDHERVCSANLQPCYRKRFNDMFTREISSKQGCYNCATHFSALTTSSCIDMGGYSVADFLQYRSMEQHVECAECKISTGYRLEKFDNLPQVLIILEASRLSHELLVSEQMYHLVCVLSEDSKAYLYCLTECQWARIEMHTAKDMVGSFSPEVPEFDKVSAVAIYRKVP